MVGQGCNGEPAQPPEKKEFEPFSFAIITDVHVGRGFEDYGAEGWVDYDLSTGQAKECKKDPQTGEEKCNEGEFNWVTDRLMAVVNWLNANYQKENIKFLVILGDISDSAEMSEFFMAKKILDNLEIPYVPLIGNHDIWSNVKDPDCWDINSTDGEIYFEKIFWRDQYNKKNIDALKELFKDKWQRQRVATKPIHLLQNYAFSYQGINFIASDYARRDSNCQALFAEPFPETKNWLRDNFKNHQGEVVIVFSHYPFAGWYEIWGGFQPWESDYLIELASKYNVSALNFGGHIHYFNNTNEVFRKDSKVPVIVTKGLMGGKDNRKEKEDPDFLRIVKVKGSKIEDIDYEGCDNVINISTGFDNCTQIIAPVETPSGSTPTITPAASQIACPAEGKPKFTQGQEVITTDALKVRENPGLGAKEIKVQPKGTSGKILEGPVCADNYIWWKVEYQDGTIGWSAENWLEAKTVIIRTPTPVVQTLTPTPIPETSTPIPETPTPPSITEIKGKIAFVSDRDGNSEIYVMEANGQNQINLTNNPANDWDPAWSPDGKKIAFVSNRDGDAEIYVMNADGSNVIQLTQNLAKDEEPNWSPDGRFIVFQSERDGNKEIYIMDQDGANQRNLTNYSNRDESPCWSPDGKKIVFTSEGRGEYPNSVFPLLYTMNADGTEVSLLPGFYRGFAERPKASDWSPDGKYIAFSNIDEGIGGYIEMMLYDIKSQFAHLIGEFLGRDFSGTFSPDGKWLSFSSARKDKNWEIYLINLETKEIRRLTDNKANDWSPAWISED